MTLTYLGMARQLGESTLGIVQKTLGRPEAVLGDVAAIGKSSHSQRGRLLRDAAHAAVLRSSAVIGVEVRHLLRR